MKAVLRLGIICEEISGGGFQWMWRQDEVVIFQMFDAHGLQPGTNPQMAKSVLQNASRKRGSVRTQDSKGISTKSVMFSTQSACSSFSAGFSMRKTVESASLNACWHFLASKVCLELHLLGSCSRCCARRLLQMCGSGGTLCRILCHKTTLR